MIPQDDAQLDDIIDRLLDVRNGRPGRQVSLTEQVGTGPRGSWNVSRASICACLDLCSVVQTRPAPDPELPPAGHRVQEIRQLCLTAKEIFMTQPNLLELEAPIKICGALQRS